MGSDRFLDLQSNQPTLVITDITTNSACVDHVVTAVHQFCLYAGIPVRYYIRSFFYKEGHHFSNPNSIHTYSHHNLFFHLIGSYPLHGPSFHSLHRQLSSALSFLSILLTDSYT